MLNPGIDLEAIFRRLGISSDGLLGGRMGMGGGPQFMEQPHMPSITGGLLGGGAPQMSQPSQSAGPGGKGMGGAMPAQPPMMGGGMDFNMLAQQMAGPAPQIPIRPTPMGHFSPPPGGAAPGQSTPAPPAMILPDFHGGGFFPPGGLM